MDKTNCGVCGKELKTGDIFELEVIQPEKEGQSEYQRSSHVECLGRTEEEAEDGFANGYVFKKE